MNLREGVIVGQDLKHEGRWLVHLPYVWAYDVFPEKRELVTSLKSENLSIENIEQEKTLAVGVRVRIIGMDFTPQYNYREGIINKLEDRR